MSVFLRYKLFRLARRSKPSQAFLSSLEARLFPREEILSMHRLRLMRFAVAPALLVVSLLGGTGVYAYSSDAVLPGHALYPLRQSVEGFEIQLASVTGMKDRVRLRLLERHAREKRLMQEEKKAPKPPVKGKKASATIHTTST
jgi:hypothetical protein